MNQVICFDTLRQFLQLKMREILLILYAAKDRENAPKGQNTDTTEDTIGTTENNYAF